MDVMDIEFNDLNTSIPELTSFQEESLPDMSVTILLLLGTMTKEKYIL